MYALWQDIFKLVIPFMHCAMISFRCVVKNDPGVDKYTQEGLEANSGFSQEAKKMTMERRNGGAPR